MKSMNAMYRAVLVAASGVLAGAASYVTYTNALFDRTAAGRPHVYLPQYGLPGLDAAAREKYEALGYAVKPIDVTGFYRFNGSLGCLVNVLRRGPQVS